jgi:hypothetical protein
MEAYLHSTLCPSNVIPKHKNMLTVTASLVTLYMYCTLINVHFILPRIILLYVYSRNVTKIFIEIIVNEY